MIKAEIVNVLAQKMGVKYEEALTIVDQVIASIRDVIIEQGRVEIRDFGVFKIKERKGRIGRNPKNKIEYPIAPHKVVTFKASKSLKLGPHYHESREEENPANSSNNKI